MAATVEANGTHVSVQNKTVGPKHDPYARQVLTVRRLGHEFEFTSCGLCGYTYKKDGEVICGEGCGDKGRVVEERFMEDTGAYPDQWMEWHERTYIEDPMGPASWYV